MYRPVTVRQGGVIVERESKHGKELHQAKGAIRRQSKKVSVDETTTAAAATGGGWRSIVERGRAVREIVG